MSKKSKQILQRNMYEDSEELIYSTEQEIAPQTQKSHKQKTCDPKDKNKLFGGAISERIVPCSCNKCQAPVNGTLVSYIYSAGSDLSVPFVSYDCKKCGHIGFRSVMQKALPAAEFDLVYF
jgi:hypothetical protein